MAMYLLNTLGAENLLDEKVNKDTFNILFSGGNINGAMKDDVAKAKNIRKHFPIISLMGGGLGDMIMAGKLICGFVYPVCAETECITGIKSDISWHSLIDEIEFTRTDDGKNDKLAAYMKDPEEEKTAKSSTQMRYSVQYMAAGTEFVQDFIFLDGTTDLELGAFYAGLLKWFESPRLGGMAAKGFGLFDAMFENGEITIRNGEVSCSSNIKESVSNYTDFIRDEGTTYLSLLDVRKVSKSVKKTDNSN